ncbi:hypothetical protein ACOSQ4_022758 [Xanthoceras sorbifolium]
MAGTCGERMVPGTDVSANSMYKCCNGKVSGMDQDQIQNEEILEHSNQLSAAKPPRNLATMRHCSSSAWLSESEPDIGIVCLSHRYSNFPSPRAFYGVFDGHGGVDAASFARENMLKYIVEDSHFPSSTKRAVKSAYVKADHALADAKSLDRSSGTTTLAALMLGRCGTFLINNTMLIANAGDSRAVLGKRGRAIELSKDHKPNCTSERLRIEKLSGVIYDGYLNGQLSVARALGDWHIKGTKDSICPLSCEPELEEIVLTEEDEFVVLGCDGLWDVMSSQCAMTMVRKELMQSNDPEKCSKTLVKEALQRNSCDNLTVVVICFSPNSPPRIEIPRSHKRKSISAEGLDHLKGVLNGL